MDEYEMRILIDELQKLVVIKAREVICKNIDIDLLKDENKNLKSCVENLKAEIERLEAQLNEKKENK